MSARRRPARGPREASGARARTHAAGGRRTWRWVVLALAGVAAVAALVIGRGLRPAAPTPLTIEAIDDSLRAAVESGRRDRTLEWLARYRALRPESDDAKILHAIALHDFVWGVPEGGRARTATRTSLDRVEAELQSLAILDTVFNTAPDPATRVRAGRYFGNGFENYGLTVDALFVYASALQLGTGDTLVAGRVRHLQQALRDPALAAREERHASVLP